MISVTVRGSERADGAGRHVLAVQKRGRAILSDAEALPSRASKVHGLRCTCCENCIWFWIKRKSLLKELVISFCDWSRVSILQIRICFNQASEKAYVSNDCFCG
ncbi:hypothetical protein MUK42_01089 [Musa troglodytarum]|uniref:Uncharacterized protein n=1 Tax=Musa troglodytarum TaxID=320322 RepID=A0A9E7K952_9LILI|nr:hypothetical protein MUK42_01089 [Musa troglodytarum]